MPLMVTAVWSVTVLGFWKLKGSTMSWTSSLQGFFNTTELDLIILCFYLLMLLSSVFLMCHQNHPKPGIKECEEHFRIYYFCME